MKPQTPTPQPETISDETMSEQSERGGGPNPGDVAERIEARERVLRDMGAVVGADLLRQAASTIRALLSELHRLKEEIARRDDVARATWGDQEDEHTPAIEAAHPVNSGDHDTFARALALVGTRHGKYELVALVNWLLGRAEAAEAERDAATDQWAKVGKIADERSALAQDLGRQLSAAKERIAELERGLKPFAEACAHLHPAQPDDGVTLDGFKVSDFRRAARLLSPEPTASGEGRADQPCGLCDSAGRCTFACDLPALQQSKDIG